MEATDTKKKRRTKAEIAAARATEEAAKVEASAAEMRSEIAKGEGRKAKAATALLAALNNCWDDINGLNAVRIDLFQTDTAVRAEFTYTRESKQGASVSLEETPSLL